MDSGTGKPLNNYDQVSCSLEFTLYSAVNSGLLDIFLLFASPLMQVNVIFFKACIHVNGSVFSRIHRGCQRFLNQERTFVFCHACFP